MLSKEQIQTLIWKLAQEERNWLFDESPRNSGMVEPVLALPACTEASTVTSHGMVGSLR
jgi:hypothetical protein